MGSKRTAKGFLLPPSTVKNISDSEREKWLRKAQETFVTKTPINKKYYYRILEILFPKDSGLPGPHISEQTIRHTLDVLRKSEGKSPYRDPFRRMRELQGDEGFKSIAKEGIKYQLQDLNISQKREPRQSIPKKKWISIKENFGFKCAHCGKGEPDVKLSPDHKRPRSRGGSNEFENIQPLCEQCNILKSSSCKGCDDNCYVCPWAYPETYKPIKIDDDNRIQIQRRAEKEKKSQSEIANTMLRTSFLKEK